MNKIKKLILQSGKTRSQIAKEAQINQRTIDKWYYNETKVNTTLIKMLLTISRDEKELYKNIKSLIDDTQ